MKLLRGVGHLKNFQKNFSFYASSSMTHFSLGAKSEKGIGKENSVAMIKRNIHCFLKAVTCGRSLVWIVGSTKAWDFNFPKPI